MRDSPTYERAYSSNSLINTNSTLIKTNAATRRGDVCAIECRDEEQQTIGGGRSPTAVASSTSLGRDSFGFDLSSHSNKSSWAGSICSDDLGAVVMISNHQEDEFLIQSELDDIIDHVIRCSRKR